MGRATLLPNLCGMVVLLVILLLLLALVLWLLWAPLQLEIDSRQPVARLRWISIGRAAVWYEEEWWLSFRVFFFQKTLRLASIKAKPKKRPAKRMKKPKRRGRMTLQKMIRLLRSFRVQEWKWALDTGDYPLNARLYPLNFTNRLRNHLLVNFNNENYLYVSIWNRPWRMLWAFLR
jgi:hypothetical protein